MNSVFFYNTRFSRIAFGRDSPHPFRIHSPPSRNLCPYALLLSRHEFASCWVNANVTSSFLVAGNRASSQSSTIAEKPKAENVLENDEDEEETESSTESEETESEEEPTKPDVGNKAALEKTDIGPLLARSAHARDSGSAGSAGTNASYRRSSRDDGSSSSSR